MKHILFLGFGVFLMAQTLGAQPDRPNVVIILTDDQGYGDLAAHGHPNLVTPNMDKLAAESLELTNFHVAPTCTPTRSQLMTGIDALHNGAYQPHGQYHLLNQDHKLLPQYFQEEGYQTALYGKWHLGGNSLGYRPHERGFDDAVHFLRGGHWSHPNPWNSDSMDDTYYHNGKLQDYEGYATDLWFELGNKFIQQANAEEDPFFLYLALNAPHIPWLAPARFREPYLDKGLDKESINFYAMISSLDEQLGMFIDKLKQDGQWENTIFILFTDNGSALSQQPYNAGLRGKKGSIYEGGHRVPFYISWPAGNISKGNKLDDLTEVQDLLPTLLKLCDIQTEPAKEVEGSDISPLLLSGKQKQLNDRMLVVQGKEDKWASEVMYRSWRLANGTELYDLKNDPGQEVDIAAKHPKIVRKLQSHYETWYESIVTRPYPYFIRSDEGTIQLTAYDWYDGRRVFNWPHLRAGDQSEGKYLLQVDDPGKYRISLRRWPRAADAEISGSVPEFMPFDDFLGPLPEGKAFDIREAKIQLGVHGETIVVDSGAKEVSFEVEFPEGETHLQTWFIDANDHAFGVYYVYIEAIP